MKQFIGPLILLLVSTYGCGDAFSKLKGEKKYDDTESVEEEATQYIEKEEVDGAFLKKSDFTAIPTGFISDSDEAIAELKDSDQIYLNSPEEEKEAFAKCLDEKTKGAVEIDVGEDKVAMTISTFVTECLKEPYKDLLTEFESVYYEFIEFQCTKGKISLKYEKYDDLEENIDNEDCESVKILYNGSVLTKGIGEADGQPFKADFTLHSYFGEETDVACEFGLDGEIYTSHFCFSNLASESRFTFEDDKVAQDTQAKQSFRSNNLKFKKNDERPFYTSGSQTGFLQNWTFTLSYSDPEKGPALELKGGSKTIDVEEITRDKSKLELRGASPQMDFGRRAILNQLKTQLR